MKSEGIQTPTLDEVEAELARQQALTDELRRKAVEVRSREVQTALSEIQAKVLRYGLSVKQVFGPIKAQLQGEPAERKDGRQVRRRTAPLPKYQDVIGNTWSGRGKQPRWFSDALAGGKSAEDLLIRR